MSKYRFFEPNPWLLLLFFLLELAYAEESTPISSTSLNQPTVLLDSDTTPITSETYQEGASQTKSTSPITFGAQARLRPEVRNNTDYGGNRNYTLVRFRLSTTYAASKNTRLFFQPQFSKAFGTPTFPGISTTTNSFQQTSGAFFDTALSVHQAYLDYQPFENLRMIGGRQILTYGDELLVGAALGWANVGRSFDAIKFTHNFESLGFLSFKTDLFWSRLVDTSTWNSAGTGSADFGGIYQNIKFGRFLQNFDPYFFYLADTRTTANLSLWTFGLRLKSSFEWWDYRAETTFQTGSNLTSPEDAFQEDLEIGYTVLPSSSLRIALNGFYASPQFNQLFPAAHKWLGVADVLGRRNIYGGGIRSSASLHSQWNVTLDFYQFYRVDIATPVYMLNGLTTLGSANATTSSHVGSELDFNILYKVSSVVNLSTGINTLFASDYLISNFGPINPIYAFFEIEARY
jgi:hypothetical protein